MAKRKLPKVGIFDPNLSQDPQFGNVSTLADGLKRIHFHITAKPSKADDYLRFSIIIPECFIPTISSTHIDNVEKISLPIVKGFHVQMMETTSFDEKVDGNIYIGLFECDKFDLGPFPKLNGDAGTATVPFSNIIEPLFILNKPAAYFHFKANGESKMVSNLAERGYIFLQNYFNLFVGMKNAIIGADTPKKISFNVYIDYKTCDTTYKEALIWKSDFESLIQNRLKYRAQIAPDNNTVVLCSRGLTYASDNKDPSKFNELVNDLKVFKVPERPKEEAALDEKQLIWSRAVQKYLGASD